LIEQRLKSIRSAEALTDDPGNVMPYRLHAVALVAQLRSTLAVIDVFDEQIAALARTPPSFVLFDSLPHAGLDLTPRLLAAFGEQRERFRSAVELQQYASIAPVNEPRARTAGCTGAGNTRLSCDRLLSNRPARRSTNHSGRALTIGNSEPKTVHTRQRCGHWHAIGYESSTAAGKHGHSTKRVPI
jgi:hypothetical protein